MMRFDISKYVGKWYELLRYPTTFETSSSYNITADYRIDMMTRSVIVTNSSIDNGRMNQITGVANPVMGIMKMEDGTDPLASFIVSFGQPQTTQEPNYVVEQVWKDKDDNYMFAVVTDLKRRSLYLFSRNPRPSLQQYNYLIDWLSKRYDMKKVIQVPHFQ